MLAVRADVVRTQGVYLGYVRQKCRKGRAYTPSGADKIAGIVGLLYKLVRYHIHNGITVFHNTVKLLVHALLNNFRQNLAVDSVRLLVAHIHQVLLAVLN